MPLEIFGTAADPCDVQMKLLGDMIYVYMYMYIDTRIQICDPSCWFVSFENKSFVQFGEYLGPQGAQVVTNIYTKKTKRFGATSRKPSKYLDLVFSNATLSVADLKKYYVYTYMHSIYIYIFK